MQHCVDVSQDRKTPLDVARIAGQPEISKLLEDGPTGRKRVRRIIINHNHSFRQTCVMFCPILFSHPYAVLVLRLTYNQCPGRELIGCFKTEGPKKTWRVLMVLLCHFRTFAE